MISSLSRPKLGVSSCLLGRSVRYNGGHCQSDWITERLAKHVDFVSLCPEVAMGLGVPRKTLRLVKGPQLVESATERDLTELAQKTARDLLTADLVLDGYILKKNSPSCGLERVKLYPVRGGMPEPRGVGIFAEALRERFPHIPLIEEGRLEDPQQRDLFVQRIFAHVGFRALPRRMSALQGFHRDHKLLLMAHSPAAVTRLGQISASNKKIGDAFADYYPLFFSVLAKPTTAARRINVLQHAVGYFKKQLSGAEKKEFSDLLTEYRDGELPLESLLVLVRHFARKYGVEYLLRQSFFRKPIKA